MVDLKKKKLLSCKNANLFVTLLYNISWNMIDEASLRRVDSIFSGYQSYLEDDNW
jgi:hypothetical protein